MVLQVVAYCTGIVLIFILSLGQLHVDYEKDNPLGQSDNEKARGLQITYHRGGKRYVADWAVCLLGLFFWIGLVVILTRLF